MKTMNLKLPTELFEDFKEIAEKNCMNRSAILRHFIEVWVDEQKQKIEEIEEQE